MRTALRSLRPSLNTPVLVVDDLPAGPASAAIATLGAPGGMRVALAIRSERTGEVVFFGADDDLRERQATDLALDAVLSFAESMGFLFDDDRMNAVPAEARRLWAALLEASSLGGSTGSQQGSGPVREPRPMPAALEEIWLEEVAAPGPGVSSSVALTKFRSGAPGGATSARRRAEAPASEAPPLGRFRVAPSGRRP